MQAPVLPQNEAARLLNLHALQILDTCAEERFDRITRIAQRVFGVDISLVSLVDADRQWFKSRQGLGASETPRTVSFCGHTILGEDIFVVQDTKADPRFADNPLVTGSPNIRFYAGCPIREPRGFRIGTLCVIDRAPRPFRLKDKSVLHDLAAIIEGELNSTSETIVDALTGVSNRRGFDLVARHLLNLCRRTDGSAEFLMFAINDLSSINEQHGQSSGDSLLRHFADMLVKAFPTADIVARMSADKFAVLTFADSASSKSGLLQLNELAAADATADDYTLSWDVGCSEFNPLQHLTIESLMNDAESIIRAKSSS